MRAPVRKMEVEESFLYLAKITTERIVEFFWNLDESTLYILFRQMGNGFDPSTKQNRTTCRNELTVK